MDENQQQMLNAMQAKLASQQKQIDQLRAPRKKRTHWRALVAVGAVLILVAGIGAYAYNRLLESIIPL